LQPVWVTIFVDCLETGFGENFIDGGWKASIGSKILLITDDRSTSRAYTGEYDVSEYSQLKVHFKYVSVAVENNEGFKLQYSADGGNWQLANNFLKGTD